MFHLDVLIQMMQILQHHHLALRVICYVLTSVRAICCVDSDWQIVAQDRPWESHCPVDWVESDDIQCWIVLNTQCYQCPGEGATLVIVCFVVPCHPLVGSCLEVNGVMVRELLNCALPQFAESVRFLWAWSWLLCANRQFDPVVGSPEEVAFWNIRVKIIENICQTVAGNI